MHVPLMRPALDYASMEADFKAIFESGIFTRGAHVAAFQQELCAYTGAKHAFLTTSATTALWVCLRLLGVGPGDAVVVSDFSFPATSNAVEDMGATPVFADVCPRTYNMLPEALEARITPRTKAVVFVDALGNPSGLHAIQKICRARAIPLIEDAACAIGSAERGVRCGNVADLTCFSFHPRKLLCTGEGGAITTNRDDWAEWLSVKLMHGAKGMDGIALDFPDYGYNFRLPELQAAMGRRQLTRLDALIEERQRIQRAYQAALAPFGFVAQAVDATVSHNIQSLVFTVPEGVVRDDLVRFLKARQIETTIGTYCLSATRFNRETYHDVQPNAAMLYARTITFPCFAGVDVAHVAAQVQAYMDKRV